MDMKIMDSKETVNSNIPGRYPHFIEFLNFIFKAIDLSPDKLSKKISRWKNEDYLSYDKKKDTLNATINQIVDSITTLNSEQSITMKKDLITLEAVYIDIIKNIPANLQYFWILLILNFHMFLL